MKRLLLLFCFFVHFPVFADTVACPVSGKTGCVSYSWTYKIGSSLEASSPEAVCQMYADSINHKCSAQDNGTRCRCDTAGVAWPGINAFRTCPDEYYYYSVGYTNVCVPKCLDIEHWDGEKCIPSCPLSEGGIISVWEGDGNCWCRGTQAKPECIEGMCSCENSPCHKFPQYKDLRVFVGYFSEKDEDSIMAAVQGAFDSGLCYNGCKYHPRVNLANRIGRQTDINGNHAIYADIKAEK